MNPLEINKLIHDRMDMYVDYRIEYFVRDEFVLGDTYGTVFVTFYTTHKFNIIRIRHQYMDGTIAITRANKLYMKNIYVDINDAREFYSWCVDTFDLTLF